MSNHPVTPATTPPPGPAELQARFPAWTIELDATLHVWTALKSADTATRFIVAYDAAQLVAKLEAAEAAEPPEPPR